MTTQFDNEFPSKEPLIDDEAVTALAGEIGTLIRRHNAKSRFQRMVRRWHTEWRKRRDAESAFRKRRDEHARLVRDRARLRDEAAGPPRKGWVWWAVHLPRDKKSGLPTPAVIGGWTPPRLTLANCPEAPFPLPLPSCELALPEKYAALAAVHDLGTRGTTKINPWLQTPNAPGCITFRELMARVKNIPRSDELHLRSMLDEIRRDLRPRKTASRARTPVRPKDTRGGEQARTHTVATLREITRLSNTTLNKYAKQARVKTPERGRRNYRYTSADVRAILGEIIASTSEDELRARCKAALNELP